MAEHQHSNEHKQAAGDPAQQAKTPMGRGEGGRVNPARSESAPSTLSPGESDPRPFAPRPDQIGKPLTMGSNGGGVDSDIEGDGREQSINTETMKKRNAS